MRSNDLKVFFRYEKEQVIEKGQPVLRTKPDGKIEAVVINADSSEEIARRTVKLRHGDTPDKVVGRTYAFRKLMNHVLENKLIPGKQVESLYKEFGKTCKQPEIKLAY